MTEARSLAEALTEVVDRYWLSYQQAVDAGDQGRSARFSDLIILASEWQALRERLAAM
jgi:hypothetical protein